jgi:TfoX/Sxy family transcriptional regulator of competence genes
MAYDEGLEQRFLEILAGQPGLVSKRMFGGVGFMVRGNMACGVNEDMLIVRVGPAGYEKALSEPHTRPFDLTGRPMKGWVTVAPEGLESDEELEAWIRWGVEFTLTLPAK